MDYEVDVTQRATEGARLVPQKTSLRVVPGKRFLQKVKILHDLSNSIDVTLIASIDKDDELSANKGTSDKLLSIELLPLQ